MCVCVCFFFFFFKQKTAYENMPSLVGSEMCIGDRLNGDRPGSARVGREGLETAARNPRISPVLVPGAGHQVRRSDPEAFYRAVDEWLSELLPVG